MTNSNLDKEVWINCPSTMTKEQLRMMIGILNNLKEICRQTKCSFFGYFEGWQDDLCNDDVTKEIPKIGTQMD